MQFSMKGRGYQVLLIATFLPFCWFAFMAVHELGHVMAGLISGGTIANLVLNPLSFSRTDVNPNPHPLVVVWSGPLVGTILPLVVWIVLRQCKVPFAFLARFFAGFCLIANGAYISFGALDHIGDAGDMLKHGSLHWQLWLFGIVTIPTGLLLWHKLGPEFGLGAAKRKVDKHAAYVSLTLLVFVLTTSTVLGAMI